MGREASKVVFVMEKSSIVVKGLEKRLAAARFQTFSVIENFNKIEDYIKSAGVIIIYNPQDIIDDKNGHQRLVLIKDQVQNYGCSMIFIGEPRDKDNLMREFPEFLVYTWMDRPVDPDNFAMVVADEMQKYNERLEKKALKAMEQDETVDEDGGYSQSPISLGGDERKRILIVDDDASYAMMVKSWIKDKYKTDVVTAGMQAISFLLKKPVDLILLDYEMPVVDGPQVLQMLRQEPATKDIPVIFLTGVSSREGVQRVMELKPSGYVLKSTTSENLLAILQEKLHQ